MNYTTDNSGRGNPISKKKKRNILEQNLQRHLHKALMDVLDRK